MSFLPWTCSTITIIIRALNLARNKQNKMGVRLRNNTGVYTFLNICFSYKWSMFARKWKIKFCLIFAELGKINKFFGKNDQIVEKNLHLTFNFKSFSQIFKKYTPLKLYKMISTTISNSSNIILIIDPKWIIA